MPICWPFARAAATTCFARLAMASGFGTVEAVGALRGGSPQLKSMWRKESLSPSSRRGATFCGGLGSEPQVVQPIPTPIGQGVRVGESRVNFPANFAARRSRDSVYDVCVTRKSGCTQMPNSNDVAGNGMQWERVLSLLVVGASVLGGSTVLLVQALPPLLHGFP